MRIGIIGGGSILLCAMLYAYFGTSARDRDSSEHVALHSKSSFESNGIGDSEIVLQGPKAVTIEIPTRSELERDFPPNFILAGVENGDSMHLSKDGPLGDMWIKNPPKGGPPLDSSPGKMQLFERIQEAMPDAYFPKGREPMNSLSDSNPVASGSASAPGASE